MSNLDLAIAILCTLVAGFAHAKPGDAKKARRARSASSRSASADRGPASEAKPSARGPASTNDEATKVAPPDEDRTTYAPDAYRGRATEP